MTIEPNSAASPELTLRANMHAAMGRPREAAKVKNGTKPGLAVLYDRASTMSQKGNWSRQDAARFLDRVVAEHGYEGEVRQEIKSGENLTDRPVMKGLLKDISDGNVAALVCQDFTRLSRDQDGIDGRVIRQVCRDAGTVIITQDKVYNFDNDGDDLLADIGFLIGSVHKRQSITAMTRGMKEKARQGKLQPTYALYGYQWSERWPDEGAPPGVKPGSKKPGAELVIVPDEAEVVRRIFDLYEEMSQRQVAMTLNAEGLRKPLKSRAWQRLTQVREHDGHRVVVEREEPCTERLWLPVDIADVIATPLYAGIVSWGTKCRSRFMKDFEGASHHQPDLQIISMEQFNRVQRIRKERWRHPGARSDSTYIFSGLLRCRHCGGRMVGRRQHEKRAGGPSVEQRYECRAYHILGKQGCQGQNVYETIAKKAVLPALLDILQNHLRLDQALQEAANELAAPKAGNKREEYQAELARIAAAQERLVDAVADGLLPPEAVRRKQLDLMEKREYTEKRLAALDRNRESTAEITAALRLINTDLEDLLENAPPQQLARLCRLIYRSFSVQAEGVAKNRRAEIVSYEFTAEFQELLAASTADTNGPPSVSTVEGGLWGLVLELGSPTGAAAR